METQENNFSVKVAGVGPNGEPYLIIQSLMSLKDFGKYFNEIMDKCKEEK